MRCGLPTDSTEKGWVIRWGCANQQHQAHALNAIEGCGRRADSRWQTLFPRTSSSQPVSAGGARVGAIDCRRRECTQFLGEWIAESWAARETRNAPPTRGAVSGGNSYTYLDGKEYLPAGDVSRCARPLHPGSRQKVEPIKCRLRARPKAEGEGNHSFTAWSIPGREEKELILESFPLGWNSPCTACGKPNCRGPESWDRNKIVRKLRGVQVSPFRTKRSVRSRCARVHCIRPRLRHRFVRQWRTVCLALVFIRSNRALNRGMEAFLGHDVLITLKHLMKRRVATARPAAANKMGSDGPGTPMKALAPLTTLQQSRPRRTRHWWVRDRPPPDHGTFTGAQSLFGRSGICLVSADSTIARTDLVFTVSVSFL